MRWLAVVLLVSSAGAAMLASCRTTSEACEAYCMAVGAALERCDLVASEEAFDREDCEERTADVEETACDDVTSELEGIDADECDRVLDSFCPDAALACPQDCFGECCLDADCPPERPACELGACQACTEESAALYCGPTMSCYLEACVECTEETAAIACLADEGCDDHICRKRCFEAVDCGPYRTCSGGFCSEPIGTPCPDGDFGACGGGGSCVSIDATNTPVAGYCTIFCTEAADCPLDGYTCVEGEFHCLKL